MEDFVTVATYFSLAEAEAVRLALDADGIQALTTDENIGEMLVPTAFGGIKVQVAPQDVDRANEVIATLKAESEPQTADADDSGDRVSLVCPQCKADLSFPSERRGHVEVCPECGAYVDVPE